MANRAVYTTAFLALLTTLSAVTLCSCGEDSAKLNSPDSEYLSRVKPGRMFLVPFSNDLRLLRYTGMQYRGRVPRYEERKGRRLRHALRYDVYEREGDTETLLFSESPLNINENEGGFEAGTGGFPVEVDVIYHETEDRRFEGTMRCKVGPTGYVSPCSFGFLKGALTSHCAEPKDSIELRVGEPIYIGSFVFNKWSGRDGGRSATEIRWFIHLRFVDGES